GGGDGGWRLLIRGDLYARRRERGALDDRSCDGVDHGQRLEHPGDHGAGAGREQQQSDDGRRDGADEQDGWRDLERRDRQWERDLHGHLDLADDHRFRDGDGDLGRDAGGDGGWRHVIGRDFYNGTG